MGAVTGDKNSGAADNGTAPVKIGGVYKTVKPTFTNGQRGEIQIDANGGLFAALKAADGANIDAAALNADALSAALVGLLTRSGGLVFNGATWDRIRSDGTTGGQAVGGSVASAAADSGNPVKVGGKYNLTPPTFADGNRGDLQLDAKGNARIVIGDGSNANPTSFATVASLAADGVSSGRAVVWSGAAAMLFNGTSFDRLRTPNVIKTVAATAITAGSGATIWTPSAGKKFRLMGWALSVSAAASLIFGDNAVGTVILRSELLAAAGISQDPPGFYNGFLSAAANNVLKLDVTGNATVSGFVFGTEE